MIANVEWAHRAVRFAVDASHYLASLYAMGWPPFLSRPEIRFEGLRQCPGNSRQIGRF
jgi:hypothetical protein